MYLIRIGLLEVIFGEHDAFREPLIIDADEFIAVKGFKAKGKRITTYTVETINELEPLRKEEPKIESIPEVASEEESDEKTDDISERKEPGNNDILDELTGQMRLF